MLWSVWSICFVWFIGLVWFNQTIEIDQINPLPSRPPRLSYPLLTQNSELLHPSRLHLKHGSCYLSYSLIAGEALTRIIYDGSSRNRAVAKRDRRAEP